MGFRKGLKAGGGGWGANILVKGMEPVGPRMRSRLPTALLREMDSPSKATPSPPAAFEPRLLCQLVWRCERIRTGSDSPSQPAPSLDVHRPMSSRACHLAARQEDRTSLEHRCRTRFEWAFAGCWGSAVNHREHWISSPWSRSRRGWGLPVPPNCCGIPTRPRAKQGYGAIVDLRLSANKREPDGRIRDETTPS